MLKLICLKERFYPVKKSFTLELVATGQVFIHDA
jgi:hypothetical protein